MHFLGVFRVAYGIQTYFYLTFLQVKDEWPGNFKQMAPLKYNKSAVIVIARELQCWTNIASD